MTKMDIVNKVVEATGLTKKDSEAAVSAVLTTIEDAVVAGDKVQLVGFGTFEAKERSARVGHNPKTGEKIQIAASKTISFKAGKSFKEAVNA